MDICLAYRLRVRPALLLCITALILGGLSTAAYGASSGWYYGGSELYSSLDTWESRYRRDGYLAWRWRDCNSSLCATDGLRESNLQWDYAGPIIFSECASGQVLVSSKLPSPQGDVICAAKCPAGQSPNANGLCREKVDRCTAKTDFSIELPAGTQKKVQEDYLGPGPFPLRFVRYYTTHAGSPPAGWSPELSVMGTLWRTSFDHRIDAGSGSVLAAAHRPDGGVKEFGADGIEIGGCEQSRDRIERLTDGSGATTGWRLTTSNDDTERYDTKGRLLSITNRAGLVQTFSYSDATTPPSVAPRAGLLIRATDTFGRELNFTYNAAGRVSTLTAPGGIVYAYRYDEGLTGRSAGHLTSVTYPDNTVRTYHYELDKSANREFYLTGITDENQSRYSTYTYDAEGRGVTTEHALGANKEEVGYTSDVEGQIRTYVDATQSALRTFSFTLADGMWRTSAVGGSDPCPACGPASQTFGPNGNIASRTDWNGNVTTYQYDLARNLETSRTEASGSPEARTVTTAWHPTFRLPVTITEPSRETTLAYDTAGNLLTRTVRDTATGDSHTWTYTYDGNGQVLSVDGPRTDVSDVTSYTYYPNNDLDPGKRGNLASVTNAAGHVTQILAYNAHGQPTQIVDPNGLAITLGYDARQRLVSRQVGSETTTYTYDGVGQLTRVTLPDASHIDYTYDAAQRLTGIADRLGNRIAYTLDAMGNRVREEVFADSGALAQTQQRVYSSLNRLAQAIGASGQTTALEYDGQGNLVRVAAPLSRTTTQHYDALDRLTRMVDPQGGEVRYGYDALDRLASVIDPRGLTTQYQYNALGDLKRQESPDTGATTQTLDAAGNVLTRTNANGTSGTYTYDALDRVTRVTYSDDQSETYTYDEGANGLGRLTGITDSSGATAYAYDAHGRITRETRTIGAQSYVTAYAYDAAGRLAAMTTPSGRIFTYARDALGRVERIDTAGNNLAQVLVQGVTYFPFGGVKGFSYGSLAGYTRAIDADGRIAAHSRASASRTLLYDEASRITAIRDPADAANDASYGYDALDRLTGWTQGTTTQAFGYDAIGNRTSLTVGGTSYPYSVDPASNRLNGVAGPTPASYSHDAAGNLLTSSATGSFTHDARLRLVRATSGSTATDYRLNALGQRVAKLGSSGGTHYHYDAAGRLIAESDAAGKVQKEYVWLGATPVAMIESAAAPTEGTCPATPQLRPPGGFTPYERRERMEVHSGRPGKRGWEWGLGTNTRDFEASAREDLNWVSGKPYGFQLTYDGAGNASVRVTDAGTELFTLTWTGGMDVGNALRFVVRSQEGIGAGNLIRVDITSIDGQAVSESLATAGDNTLSREVRIFSGESLKDGYTVEGTVTFVFTGAYPPLGNRLDFHVTAGNVTCDTPGPGSDAQARVYYIHPDHLDTPRVLTDEANRVVWRWDSDPFGAYPADEDPDGDGTKVALNLRFPGQYFDKETNLHYNYFRDYDPQTGRYVQSDPIGLAGGLNTYGYANQNPLVYVDPRGEAGLAGAGILGGAALVCLRSPQLCVAGIRIVGTAIGAAAGYILSSSSSSRTGATDECKPTDRDKDDCDKWRKADEDRCYIDYDTPGLRWVRSACLEWAVKRWVACYRGEPDPGPFDDSKADGLPLRPRPPRR